MVGRHRFATHRSSSSSQWASFRHAAPKNVVYVSERSWRIRSVCASERNEDESMSEPVVRGADDLLEDVSFDRAPDRSVEDVSVDVFRRISSVDSSIASRGSLAC